MKQESPDGIDEQPIAWPERGGQRGVDRHDPIAADEDLLAGGQRRERTHS